MGLSVWGFTDTTTLNPKAEVYNLKGVYGYNPNPGESGGTETAR